jgi:predicted RNase H-like HicB family nuclease/uncharacterized damage-inducible protein DinB
VTSYQVYLERSGEGLCMAHVLDLPGCTARGESREEALERLPDAMAAYHSWLERHGEPPAGRGWVADERVQLQVVGESEGVGPFDAGDAAALFPPDREPVSLEEMERYLRLSGHARSDLLALARPVPQALLEWQPYPGGFSIGRVLRHVGNAEEWYVSRLVPPETLPSEWEDDADLPPFEFLEMERRTAIARLRQLTPQERGRVHTPSVWTRHPEEAWTLRKVLRRFLEHELEHTAQVRRILDLYRRGLVACLAAWQTALWEPLLGLDERTLAEEPVADDQTARDLLVGLVARDQAQLQATEAGGGGEVRDTLVGAGGESSVGEVLAELEATQAAWLAWLVAVPEEALFWHGSLPGAVERVAALSRDLQQEVDRLSAWREGRPGLTEAMPSAAALRGALLAGRRELLAASDAILAGEPVRPVCGTWTLQDVIGHVTDWEQFGVEGLRHMAKGHEAGPIPVEPITDIDAWNEAHVAARCGQPWEEVWADLQEARQALLQTLEGMDELALAHRFAFPWGGGGTPYDWLRVYLTHDREHAAGLRAALVMPAIYCSSYS